MAGKWTDQHQVLETGANHFAYIFDIDLILVPNSFAGELCRILISSPSSSVPSIPTLHDAYRFTVTTPSPNIRLINFSLFRFRSSILTVERSLVQLIIPPNDVIFYSQMKKTKTSFSLSIDSNPIATWSNSSCVCDGSRFQDCRHIVSNPSFFSEPFSFFFSFLVTVVLVFVLSSVEV